MKIRTLIFAFCTIFAAPSALAGFIYDFEGVVCPISCSTTTLNATIEVGGSFNPTTSPMTINTGDMISYQATLDGAPLASATSADVLSFLFDTNGFIRLQLNTTTFMSFTLATGSWTFQQGAEQPIGGISQNGWVLRTSAVPVPSAGTVGLLVLGLIGVLAGRRRDA
ncbi:MAG: hypothetical protein AAF529_03765 [Pseudomonadota bacterium]